MTTLGKFLGTICHTIQFVKDEITAVLSKQKFKDTFIYQIPHYIVFTSVRIFLTEVTYTIIKCLTKVFWV